MSALKGKNAIITGSTSGIGLAVARVLAGKGVNVVMNGLGDAAEIEKARQAIEKDFGVKALYHNADMTQPAQIADMVNSTAKNWGSVDILVNNAGIQYVNPVQDFDPAMWDKIIAINLSSVFHAIHHAVPHMKKKGFGRIINISSVHGLVGSVNKVGYVAAKHGVIGMTRVVALETAKENITCNAICPGWVLTDLIKKQIEIIAERDSVDFETAKHKLLSEKQPSVEFVKPEQIGEFIAFLSSEDASQMTGAAYTMDGGWTAQ